ncbi:MAG TPA: hypothetical protein DEA43_00600 [Candidatus Moranbacteria bacterium]|nr:hypothetical protein [Candidatus Moranbacteria bacterium]HBT45371.1 hypothetical protein [Candidatus Moranbacteria bacterium]
MKYPCIVREQFRALGTDVVFQIVVPSQAQKNIAIENIAQAKEMYVNFTNIFSRFISESELFKLNLAIGKWNVASDDMCEVASLSLDYNNKTDGLFDPRILGVLEDIGYADDFENGTRKLGKNTQDQALLLNKKLTEDLKIKDGNVFFGVKMDFSGIVKGYVTDKVVNFFDSNGWENFLIDSGGDIFMRGNDEDGKLWTVDVEGISAEKIMFALSNKAIATSGIGKRRWEIDGRMMHHIINPKNANQFSFDIKSVSVIADLTADADVWAKSLFLMGKKSGIIYARENNLAAVFLDCRGSAWISPEAKKYLHNL